MAYEWTTDDFWRVTPGCTIHDGDRQREIGDIEDFGTSYARMAFNHFTAVYLRDLDPSTIAPPTLATLNRMAVESFGERGHVTTLRGPIDVCTWDDFGRHCERATFYEPDAARECARWLAARGR